MTQNALLVGVRARPVPRSGSEALVRLREVLVRAPDNRRRCAAALHESVWLACQDLPAEGEPAIPSAAAERGTCPVKWHDIVTAAAMGSGRPG